jgi:hypothetical protein
LLPFVHSFAPDQRQRFYDRLTQIGSSSPKGCVQLADLFLDQGRTNDAKHQLLKAHALSATLPDSASLQTQIMTLAGKIEPNSWQEIEYTPEICRELGFVEIEKVTQPLEFTRLFGEPLVFFGRFSNTLRVTALTVRELMKDHYPVEHRSAEKGMRGFATEAFSGQKTGFSEHTLGDGGRAVIVRSEALPDSAGAKFTVRRQPNAGGTP